MSSLLLVSVWVLPSVIAGVVLGFFIGRGALLAKERQKVEQDRETVLKALGTLLKSTEQLTSDVDTHNSELHQAERTIGHLQAGGDLEDLQHDLLGQIAAVLDSNQRLEDDLVCARYHMQEQEQELDRTRHEARLDALSGVANRKAFDEALQFHLAAFKRHGEPFALVLADVDHFKWINDTHGHQAGDRVVTHIGNVLRECVRPTDHVSRYGGDEFAILLGGIDGPGAVKIAERIRNVIERRNIEVGGSVARVAVTFSMGLSIGRDGDTAESILGRVDQALYKSKHSGRNQLNTFEEQEALAS